MSENKEVPEKIRERLRQEELRRNPTGDINDAFKRAGTGNFVDLVGSLDSKSFGILIIVIIVGFVLTSIFFK